MIKWWSKSSESKAEHIAANKERDKRVRAHQLHMSNMEKMSAEAEQSMASVESPNAKEGIDQDSLSQVGHEAQKAREFIHGRSKQLKSMRARVRSGRRKASARGRALGF